MEHKFEINMLEEIKEEKKEEQTSNTANILTTSNERYTEKMLLSRIDEVGLLDDYLGGRIVTNRSSKWVEFFPKEDILQIFATFPEVFERCQNLIEKKLGPAILTISLFDDTFCNLFEKVLRAAKETHVQYTWGFGADTEEFHEFEFAISLLNTYMEEDYLLSANQRERSILKALDKFAESAFVNLKQLELQPPISSQLGKIVRQGGCSAGFTEQLSRIYTALTLTRTIICYQQLLEEKETTEENSSAPL